MMPWTADIAIIDDGNTCRIRILRDKTCLTRAAVMNAWRGDSAFCAFFNALLANAPYEAFFWETPAVTRASMDHAFECVVTTAHGFSGMPPDPHSFSRQFEAAGADSSVAVFQNLSGDAILVAPTPRASAHVYIHLAPFCRQAPEAQRLAFWHAVGNTLSKHLSDQPLWLSTSGLGVGWLHVRFDTQPKYYTFLPYRRVPTTRL